MALARTPARLKARDGVTALKGDILDADVILEQFTRIFETPIEPVARRRGIARLLRLNRLPDAVRSIRNRLRRKYRKWTADA